MPNTPINARPLSGVPSPRTLEISEISDVRPPYSPTEGVPTDPPSMHPVRRIKIGEAMRWYPGIVLGSVLLFVALGVAYGLLRETTYTAVSEVVVQPLAPDVSQLPVAIQAAEDLATNQSRLIDSDGVTVPLARRFDVKPGEIANLLTATPVLSSTVIKITAQSKTSTGSAVALANSAARRFAKYSTGQVQRLSSTGKALHAYEAASVDYSEALAVKHAFDEGKRPGKGSSSPGVSTPQEAIAAADTAKVRREALGQQYERSIQSQDSTPSVAPFVLASSAESDRTSKLEIAVFMGILAGLSIGAALATFLANRGAPRYPRV